MVRFEGRLFSFRFGVECIDSGGGLDVGGRGMWLSRVVFILFMGIEFWLGLNMFWVLFMFWGMVW